MRNDVLQLAGLHDQLVLHAVDPRRYPFLLESSGGAPGLARFDILCAFPGRERTELQTVARAGDRHGRAPDG